MADRKPAMWVSLAPRAAHRAARAGLATLAAGTAAGCSVWAGRRASCSAATLPGNPLWPSGVRPEIVEAYVDEILSDPSINIVAIPDAIERQIYAWCQRSRWAWGKLSPLISGTMHSNRL